MKNINTKGKDGEVGKTKDGMGWRFTAFALAIFFSLSAAAQAKDSVKIEAVPLLSYEQYQKAISVIVADVPARYADDIRAKFTALFGQLAQAYEEKKKKK